jgi:hypothetical protein
MPVCARVRVNVCACTCVRKSIFTDKVFAHVRLAFRRTGPASLKEEMRLNKKGSHDQVRPGRLFSPGLFRVLGSGFRGLGSRSGPAEGAALEKTDESHKHTCKGAPCRT